MRECGKVIFWHLCLSCLSWATHFNTRYSPLPIPICYSVMTILAPMIRVDRWIEEALNKHNAIAHCVSLVTFVVKANDFQAAA